MKIKLFSAYFLIIVSFLMFACSDNKINPTSPIEKEISNFLSKSNNYDSPYFEKTLKNVSQNSKKDIKFEHPQITEKDVSKQLSAPAGFIWWVANWIWDITEPYQNPTLRYGAYSLSTDEGGNPSNIDWIYVWASSNWHFLGESKWKKLQEADIGGTGYLAKVEWITSKPDPWEAEQYSFHVFYLSIVGEKSTLVS